MNILKKIVVYGWLTLSLIGWLTYAANDQEDCHWFWKTCHVSDINTIHTEKWPDSSLLDVIKNAINWCLWIMATVVLVFCMYGWFKMLTSGWDSKWYSAWRSVLKNALIGLAVILMAWMIVSVVFWFVWVLSDGNQTQGW